MNLLRYVRESIDCEQNVIDPSNLSDSCQREQLLWSKHGTRGKGLSVWIYPMNINTRNFIERNQFDRLQKKRINYENGNSSKRIEICKQSDTNDKQCKHMFVTFVVLP